MQLSHVSENGQPTMVDISHKELSLREAEAEASVHLPPEILALFDNDELKTKKGPVIATAVIAGTAAAKNTSQLIPFCHQIPLSSVKISCKLSDDGKLLIRSAAKCTGPTGVEMEALVGASVAALTVYDMLKALSHNITIQRTRLLRKTGGKSDFVSGEQTDENQT